MTFTIVIDETGAPAVTVTHGGDRAQSWRYNYNTRSPNRETLVFLNLTFQVAWISESQCKFLLKKVKVLDNLQ